MSHVQYKQLSKTIDIEHFSHFALWKLTTIYLKLSPLVKYFRVCSHSHHFWWYWLIFQYSLDILFWIWKKCPDQKKENFCFHTHTLTTFFSILILFLFVALECCQFPLKITEFWTKKCEKNVFLARTDDLSLETISYSHFFYLQSLYIAVYFYTLFCLLGVSQWISCPNFVVFRELYYTVKKTS